MMPPLQTSACRVMAKLFLIVKRERSHALTFSRLRNLRNIQTKLKSTSSDELNAVTLKISAVEYCLINFGSIDIPETEEKIFVKMYQNFSGDLLSKKLDSLQAEKRYLQAKDLELEKQGTISISRDSSSGKLYMIIWG